MPPENDVMFMLGEIRGDIRALKEDLAEVKQNCRETCLLMTGFPKPTGGRAKEAITWGSIVSALLLGLAALLKSWFGVGGS